MIKFVIIESIKHGFDNKRMNRGSSYINDSLHFGVVGMGEERPNVDGLFLYLLVCFSF